MTTYIIGHQKPDTDAVVAPMALAYLYSQKECFAYDNPMPVISHPLNPETTYIFEKFAVETPQIISGADITPEDKVVLVDHNEASQRLVGLPNDQIAEIIDHHKINLDLTKPIFATFKSWGSSCTIAYYLMETNDVTPNKSLASLMLCAVLSDTVGYKSATTTQKDKEVGNKLASLAGITDIDGLTLEIFNAKSDISTLSSQDIVKNDYKIFDFPQKTFIGQIETIRQDEIFRHQKADLLKAMQQIKETEKVDLLFLAVTDILKVNTKLIILGDEEAQIAQKAFSGSVTENILDIGPLMSRKKEFAPAIEKALN